MPTYGRKAALLENSIALFNRQTYPQKKLLIYDDSGILNDLSLANLDNVLLMTSSTREPDMGSKYNAMLATAKSYDAVVVWDDDDIYLPNHLEEHAKALSLGGDSWSKPPTIWSAYFSPPRKEPAAGRFHGSMAISAGLLDEVGGWIPTKRATFDQEMLSRLGTVKKPIDTPSTYVYRWQSSGASHCSGGMSHSDWYDRYQPDSIDPIHHLYPKLDQDTENLLGYLAMVSDLS